MKSDQDQGRQHDSEQDADTVHQQHDASYNILLSSKQLFEKAKYGGKDLDDEELKQLLQLVHQLRETMKKN